MIEHHTSTRRPAVAVLVGIVLYTVIFSWWSVRRADNFNAGWYDLGIMTQTVWDVGHGHGFTFTNPEVGPRGQHGINAIRTSIHTDYLLILLAPLSWFGRTMVNLLVVQSVVLAAGAWYIWRLTIKILGRPWLGALFAWAYLLYPPLQYANLFEFHPVTLAATFYLAAADAILAERHRLFWLWAALALVTKEQVGLTLGLLAGYLYFQQGDRRRARWALTVPWAWSLLQLFLVIPLSRPGLSSSFTYGKFYGGDTNTTELLQRLWPPPALWHKLATRVHLDAVRQLLGPVGLMIPFFSPILLLAIPEVLLYWLSDSPNQQTLFLHYHALFIPFIWLAFLFGCRNMVAIINKVRAGSARLVTSLVVVAIMAGTGAAIAKTSPWPWTPATRWRLATWQERLTPQVTQAISLIPTGASVGLTQNLGPLLAERPVVELLPNKIKEVQYIIILQRFFDSTVATNDKRLVEKQMLDRLIPWLQASPAYRQLYHHDRVYLFQRLGSPAEAEPEWPAGLLGR